MEQRVHRVGCALGERHSGRIVRVARLDRCIMADFDRCVQCQVTGFQFLINDVSGQDLGHTGWHARHITVIGIEYLPGVAIHDECAFRCKAQCGSRRKRSAEAESSQQEYRKQSFFQMNYPLDDAAVFCVETGTADNKINFILAKLLQEIKGSSAKKYRLHK